MASTSFRIPDGTYSIRSASNNMYLTRSSTNSDVVAQPRLPNNDASQLWTLSRASNGDYEIKSSSGAREPWRVNLNQLGYSTSGRTVTWNIEPRGSDAYVIGNAANANAIQLPNRSGAVAVVPRTNVNGARQRWMLEPDPLNPQSILNSLNGFWRVTWGTHPSGEGLLILQASNGVAQGNGHDTWGRRYTCVVRHLSGNKLHFDFSLTLGSGSPLVYEATISADRRTITGVKSIQFTRIS